MPVGPLLGPGVYINPVRPPSEEDFDVDYDEEFNEIGDNLEPNPDQLDGNQPNSITNTDPKESEETFETQDMPSQ